MTPMSRGRWTTGLCCALWDRAVSRHDRVFSRHITILGVSGRSVCSRGTHGSEATRVVRKANHIPAIRDFGWGSSRLRFEWGLQRGRLLPGSIGDSPSPRWWFSHQGSRYDDLRHGRVRQDPRPRAAWQHRLTGNRLQGGDTRWNARTERSRLGCSRQR